jgi:hypothetical protein
MVTIVLPTLLMLTTGNVGAVIGMDTLSLTCLVNCWPSWVGGITIALLGIESNNHGLTTLESRPEAWL